MIPEMRMNESRIVLEEYPKTQPGIWRIVRALCEYFKYPSDRAGKYPVS
jgi:hypothetical protein